MPSTQTRPATHIEMVPMTVGGPFATDVDVEFMPVPKPNLPFFVYGTLRVGQGNWDWALQGRTSREQEATFAGGALFDGGAFPYMIREAGITDEHQVIGDLMDVPAENYAAVLDDLDNLEGYDPQRGINLYRRVEVDVTTADGETVRAYTYIADSSQYGRVAALPLVASGDWLRDGERFQR